ncbi:MAG: polysaccharide biosynthesis C-terminal domain-containing protein, partial [Pseudomonadota bacterium]
AVIQIVGLYMLAQAEWLSATTAYYLVGISCGLVGFIGLIKLGRRLRFSWYATTTIAQRHWQFGKWLVGGQVVSACNQWASYWLLALFLSTFETGVFSACMNIILLSNPLFLGMSNILDPRLSRAFNDGGCAELERVVKKVTVIMGVVIGAFALFLIVLGEWLVALFYNNPAYAGNGHMISVLAISLVFSGLTIAASLGLRPLERTDLAFVGKMADFAVVIALFIPLIHYWGMLGGAYAMLVASLFSWVLRRVLFYRELRRVKEREGKDTANGSTKVEQTP